MTQLHRLFNRLSTIVMIFLGTQLIIWLPILTAGDGVLLAEKVASKLYLENYDELATSYNLTGNIWNIIDALKNGNLISIILFGFFNMYMISKLTTMTKRSLISHILLQ